MRPNPALDKAQELIRHGHSAKALELLERHSVDPQCAARLRELYLGEQQQDKALFVTRQLAFGQGAEAFVSRSVAALMEGDLDSAVRECEQALGLEPDLATAHNHLGRALQNAGNSLQAISALRKAVELEDNYPEAWANLALVLRASGAMEEAVSAYRKAVDLAPGFIVAELNLGITLLASERAEEALFCLQSVLKRHPGQAEALTNAGLALHQLGRFSEARQSLEQATASDESNAMAWCCLGILLHEINAPEAALQALERAQSLDPMDVDARVEAASIHEQAGRLEQAQALLDRAAQIDPTHPRMQLELARLKRRQGKLKLALQQLQAMGSQPLPLRLTQQHRLEAGVALDRAGYFEQAVDAFVESNRIHAASARREGIDPQGFEARCSALQSWLQSREAGLEAPVDEGSDLGEDLCFVMGFPGSGGDLLTAMLDLHPQVECLTELPTMETVAEQIRQLPHHYPHVLDTLNRQQRDEYRQIYRQQTQRYLDGRKPACLVDKMSLRLLNTGLIHALFPHARILFCLRHPNDLVMNNFVSLHAVNEAFIHFDTLESSVKMYSRVMGLWQEIEARIPLRLEYVRHESLLEEPHAELARVCDFLGLDMHDEMTEPTAQSLSTSLVQTISLQQLTDPGYPRTTDHWRNYRFVLEPFMAQLEPFAELYDYA